MVASPSAVGARAEMAVAYALHVAGWDVFAPFFAAHSRVDLVATRGLTVLRVQCKTSRLSAGAVRFRTCSNTSNVPRTYEGEIDAFGVYSPELDEVFLVPLADAPSRAAYLRIDPPRNAQASGVRWARDYALRPA